MFLQGVNRLNPNKMSLSTSQWSWVSTNTLRGIPVCIPVPLQWNNRVHRVFRPNTTLKKFKKNSAQSQWYNTMEGPQEETAANKLYSPRTQLICSFSIKHTFLGGNLPHDFLVPSRRGLYQTCVPLLHSNEPLLLHTSSVSPCLPIMAFPPCLIICFALLSFFFLSAYCFFYESGFILSFKSLPLVHLNAFFFFLIHLTYAAFSLYSSVFPSCTFLFLQVIS